MIGVARGARGGAIRLDREHIDSEVSGVIEPVRVSLASGIIDGVVFGQREQRKPWGVHLFSLHTYLFGLLWER